MQYLIGSLGTVVFLSLVLIAYWLGAKQHKAKAQPINEEDKRKQERIQKEFDEMMNYNVDTAYGGGKK